MTYIHVYVYPTHENEWSDKSSVRSDTLWSTTGQATDWIATKKKKWKCRGKNFENSLPQSNKLMVTGIYTVTDVVAYRKLLNRS